MTKHNSTDGVTVAPATQPHEWREGLGYWQCKRCFLVSHSGQESACTAGVMATGPTKEDELRQALQAANENTQRWKERALNLRVALEPFALALDRFEGTPGVHFDDSLELWQVDNGTGKLCVRDLRRARDALLPPGVAPTVPAKPAAWLHYDPHAIEGEFPWVLMVNQDHPLIQAKTDRIVLLADGVTGTQGDKA